MPWGLTPAHLIIILAIVLIVVGPGKLPETGAAIGRALRGFKDAVDGNEGPQSTTTPTQPGAPMQSQAPIQQPPQQYAPQQYPPQYVQPQQPQYPAAPQPQPYGQPQYPGMPPQQQMPPQQYVGQYPQGQPGYPAAPYGYQQPMPGTPPMAAPDAGQPGTQPVPPLPGEAPKQG
jgi:TatA/E family protein of Tat protein translocase